MRHCKKFQIGSLLVFAAGQMLYAQLDTGAISGTVRDSTQAVVQAATVKIVETETGIAVSLLSNSDGLQHLGIRRRLYNGDSQGH